MSSKETMILFVYDTECLKKESDDPVSAVLYFHPSWVSDTQKVALCGQLMGTSYFLKDCFFKPRILALQNGKFVLKKFGRFTLAVGTDRNISDQLLQKRAELLSELLTFYHRDLQSLYDQYMINSQKLPEKLFQIFETYIPMLQRNGNLFQNVPRVRMPKTASHIFLEAIQTLQCCQQMRGVLGGVILYHNKVVATQLDAALTKHLVLSDPRHVRSPAEHVLAPHFHVPHGVQMIVVYIDKKQYHQLAADALRSQQLQTAHLAQGTLPFQYGKRKIKRDKSLIFTHIPEEEQSSSSTEPMSDQQKSGTTRPKSMRPTHLPLRTKSVQSKDFPESGIGSINFDETDSYPEFIGRTSVCSTPMAENKVLPVGSVMSICANPEEDESNSNGKASGSQSRRNSLKAELDKFFQNFIGHSEKSATRRKSTSSTSTSISLDMQDALRAFSKKLGNITTQGTLKSDVNRNGKGSRTLSADGGSPNYIENDERSSRTITDPTYPVFNANGQPISRNLFQHFLDQYYKLVGIANAEAKEDAELSALVAEFEEFNDEILKLDELMRKQATEVAEDASADRNLNLALKTALDKKSMSLPLKSASGDQQSSGSEFRRKQSYPNGGVALTPLMTKLSVLALNDITPSAAAIEIQTPLTSSKVFPRRSSLKCDDAVDALTGLTAAASVTTSQDNLQRVDLYICGQKNMTLMLLTEEGACMQQSLVQHMFEICVAKFPTIEYQLSETLNVNVDGESCEGDYSFMGIDDTWDVLQRHGPWNNVELNTLESMHNSLHQSSDKLTDLILRSHDSAFYGYKCGRTEILYKEPAHKINGIPPPSDPIGNIQKRAKTRLERDHSYVLF